MLQPLSTKPLPAKRCFFNFGVRVYLLARKLDKMAFVGTCAWFFCVTNLVKVPLSWNLGLISISSLVINLIMLPAIVAGLLGGRLLLGKVSQAFFEWLAIVMAIASAARMIMA